MADTKTAGWEEPGPGAVTAGDLVGLRRQEPNLKSKPKMPRLIQAWPKESMHQRMHSCASLLNVFGLLTDAEIDRVRMRIRKAAEKGEFHE